MKILETVILVHGFYHDYTNMLVLQEYLSEMGYDTVTVDLPTKFNSLKDCCATFKSQLQKLKLNSSKIHFVGHSMGGLIIRSFLSENKVPNLGKCVLITTPNQGSRLADILSPLMIPAQIFKPLRALTSTAQDILPPLNSPCPEFGIIAGKCNQLFWGKLFLSDNSDGRVEVESSKFDLMTDFIILPYHHKAIHFKKDTAQLIDSFLQTGQFERALMPF